MSNPPKLLLNTNIWSLWGRGWLCVPTNVGWKSDGSNVMGRGLAKQADDRFRGLALMYGRLCRAGHEDCVVFESTLQNNEERLIYHDLRLPSSMDSHGLIMTPTKSLDPVSPHLSWKQFSSWERIQQTLDHLINVVRPVISGLIFVPLLGAGNGGISKEEVTERLVETLTNHEGFVIVDGNAQETPSQNIVSSVSSTSQEQTQQTSQDDVKEEPQNVAVNTSSIANEYEVVQPKNVKKTPVLKK